MIAREGRVVRNKTSHRGGRRRISRTGEFPKAANEDGFTLIELLVVCLVIAALCAIAIPQFLSQSGKATDASAKEVVDGAQTAAETIATNHDGSYGQVSKEEIHAADPDVAVGASESHAYVSSVEATAGGYSITATATNGDELTLAKSSSGAMTRTCRSPIAKNGCSGGRTGSW